MAKSQRLELFLLRELNRRGLKEEDVLDIEFKDEADVEIRLTLIEQEKEIARLRESSAAKESASTPPSEPKIDTGGPSGEAAKKRVQKADGFRNTAKDLRSKGNYEAATWQALRAAHVDPSKALLVKKGDTDLEE
jgi:hypothetical protein